jgi:hypothetical protein
MPNDTTKWWTQLLGNFERERDNENVGDEQLKLQLPGTTTHFLGRFSRKRWLQLLHLNEQSQRYCS